MQHLLVSPILIVLLNTNCKVWCGVVSPTMTINPTLFVILCIFLGFLDL
jgi:hypothetical protein